MIFQIFISEPLIVPLPCQQFLDVRAIKFHYAQLCLESQLWERPLPRPLPSGTATPQASLFEMQAILQNFDSHNLGFPNLNCQNLCLCDFRLTRTLGVAGVKLMTYQLKNVLFIYIYLSINLIDLMMNPWLVFGERKMDILSNHSWEFGGTRLFSQVE